MPDIQPPAPTIRKPIGMIMLSQVIPQTTAAVIAARGATAKPTQADYNAAFLALADRSIDAMRSQHARGCIFWDWHLDDVQDTRNKYMGDTRVPTPQIDPIGKTMCSRIRAAGFEVGFCERPGIMVKQPWGYDRAEPKDYMQNVGQKMDHDAQAFGATIFYIDSTTDQNGDAMRFTRLSPLRQFYPKDKYLICIESFTAPVGADWGTGQALTFFAGWATSAQQPLMPPEWGAPADAFRLIAPRNYEGQPGYSQAELDLAVRQGHCLVFRAWVGPDGDPYSVMVRAAYEAAGK